MAAAAGGRAGRAVVAASWGLGPPDSSSASGGYVAAGGRAGVRGEGAEAAEVDADDPVMASSPGDDGPRLSTRPKSRRRRRRRRNEGDANADASFGCVFSPRRRVRKVFGRVDRRAFVALDVETDDGSRLGDTDAVDQHGLRAHVLDDARDERARRTSRRRITRKRFFFLRVGTRGASRFPTPSSGKRCADGSPSASATRPRAYARESGTFACSARTERRRTSRSPPRERRGSKRRIDGGA